MRWKLVEVIERGRNANGELEGNAEVEQRASRRVNHLRRARTDTYPLRRTRIPGTGDWRIERFV